MNKKLTVTIGIPAYNEEDNIEYLLRSVLDQDISAVELAGIVVYSDGSDDDTNEIVKKISTTSPIVKLDHTNQRMGKAYQLNKFHSSCTADILIQFDADIVLANNDVINNLVSPFLNDDSVVMVSGDSLPLKGRTFIERVTNASDMLWREVRVQFNGGSNIYNASGCITALSYNFSRNLVIPTGTVADQQYSYLMATKTGKFFLAKKAIVKYRSPDNTRDFLLQASRSLNEKNQIYDLVGDNIDHHYYIPIAFKIKAIIKSMLLRPISTSCAIVLQIFLRHCSPNQQAPDNGLWSTVKSTKKIFK